jgi:hypothetical protein
MGADVHFHCPTCDDRVTVRSDEPVAVPVTDDDYETLTAIFGTLHAIDAHLADIGILS